MTQTDRHEDRYTQQIDAAIALTRKNIESGLAFDDYNFRRGMLNGLQSARKYYKEELAKLIEEG